MARGMSEPPIFDLVLRGYRRQDVDSYLLRLDNYLDQRRSGRASGPAPEPAPFDIALRGYDRAQVDDFIAGTLAEARALPDQPDAG